jgi:hypothetical protein
MPKDTPRPWADYGPIFRQLWPRLSQLQGDVAEFGVYQGGTARQLAEICERPVWAFDTYEGMPSEDYNAELDRDVPGSFNPNADPFRMFLDCPLVLPIKGRFADTLPAMTQLLRVKFALVYIDCDLYASCKQVLDWLPDFLVDGAAIVFDDYTSHRGIAKAVDEFMLAHAKEATFQVIQSGPGALIEWRKS